MGFSENRVPQNPLVKIICPLSLLRYRGGCPPHSQTDLAKPPGGLNQAWFPRHRRLAEQWLKLAVAEWEFDDVHMKHGDFP